MNTNTPTDQLQQLNVLSYFSSLKKKYNSSYIASILLLPHSLLLFCSVPSPFTMTILNFPIFLFHWQSNCVREVNWIALSFRSKCIWDSNSDLLPIQVPHELKLEQIAILGRAGDTNQRQIEAKPNMILSRCMLRF